MRHVVPLHYDIVFEPNLRNFTFHGKESININCKKPTHIITLNTAELEIKNCQISSKNKILRTKIKLDKKKEELQITIPKTINGKAILQIEFAGILNDRLLGFYRSKYQEKGKTKYLATTQFEAADARRAFPCWDEPDAKATFNISVLAEKNYSAISNMPEISKKKIGKKILHKFSTTPIMSTYLIYLGVGEFEFLKSKTNNTIVRIITTKGNKSQAKYSLELAKKLLNAYENYFGIKYPLPKLDLIAVPDFAAGAMENWGSITFRETILLYDPKTSSTRTKQYISEVISHEIAHQWFGNLVTMRWWNDLWLNESFATFMATKFVDKFYPEWDLWDQFLEETMNTAMGIDALKSSHPINVKVKHPSEIREIFDAISYDKGGCILRMLEQYVGESNFRKGLKRYLTQYKYQNATGDDLWNSIGIVSKKPIRKMVKTWIDQIGFPIIETQQKNSELLLRQKRFLMEPTRVPQKEIWQIPVNIANKKTMQKLISRKSEKIPIKPTDFGFVINSGRTGFYRVQYDNDMLFDLKQLIGNKQISYIDRWAIQNDLFALCVSGNETIYNYLDFSEAYYDDYSYLASVNVASNLNFLFLLTFWEDFSNIIKKNVIHFFRSHFVRLGWDAEKNTKHTDSFFRSFAIFVLGRMDDGVILDEATKKFNKFLKNPHSLHPDLRESIYSLAAWQGNSKTHKQLTEFYKRATTQEEKLRFLSALCNFRDEKLLLKTLDFSQTSHVRPQNMRLPIIKVASNPYGRKILWPWLKKNWKKLSKKVGEGNPILNRAVGSIYLIVDDSKISDVREFFKKNPTPGTEQTLEQVIERVRIHSKFLKRMRAEFN